MKETYCYRLKVSDLWILAMYNIYRSLAGICNLVFTGAMLVLTAAKWTSVTEPGKFLLLMGCIWFPVIQPYLVYQNIRKSAAGVTEDISISVCESGIQVDLGDESSQIPWKHVKAVTRMPAALVIFVSGQEGYILPNRVLGKQKRALYEYAGSQMQH